MEIKSVRYDVIRERYLEWNDKHFRDICGLYFDDEDLENKK